MARSINAQAEFWIRVGMLAELNPQLSYQELCRKLLKNKSTTLQDLLNELDPSENPG